MQHYLCVFNTFKTSANLMNELLNFVLQAPPLELDGHQLVAAHDRVAGSLPVRSNQRSTTRLLRLEFFWILIWLVILRNRSLSECITHNALALNNYAKKILKIKISVIQCLKEVTGRYYQQNLQMFRKMGHDSLFP